MCWRNSTHSCRTNVCNMYVIILYGDGVLRVTQVLLPGVVSKEARDSAKLSQQLAVAVQNTKSSSSPATAAVAPSAASPVAVPSGASLTRVEYAALDARLAAIESALGSAATVRYPLFPWFELWLIFASLDHFFRCCVRCKASWCCSMAPRSTL